MASESRINPAYGLTFDSLAQPFQIVNTFFVFFQNFF